MNHVGIGYDVHQLVAGRDLVLGGVKIPYEKGLDGHSDADVALHALTDALLGATASGDIGERFPDTDEANRGIDSRIILESVLAEISAQGFEVVNVDIVLELQAPRIAPFRDAIRERVAGILGITVDRVGLQAKTGEGVDAVGTGAAISALAVVLIEKTGK